MQLVIAIFIAIIVYILQQRLYCRLWDKNLKVCIDFHDSYVACGEKTYLTETIYNAKFLPLPVFHVKFSTDRSFRFLDYENAAVTDSYHRNDVFSVMGNQKITRTLEFYPCRRGLYTVEGIDVIARDFFMTRSFARHIKNQAELYVFPGKYADADFDVLCHNLLGDIEIRRALTEDPYTFRGIRDYDRTCNMGRINWKATARTGDMKVNVYGHSAEQKIKILLNMEPQVMLKVEYMQETSIRLASSIARYFLDAHIPVMLASNGTDKITGETGAVEAGAALEHMISVDKYLARIRDNAGLDIFMALLDREIAGRDENISYVVISPYCKDDLLIKLDYLVRMGIDVSMVVPYYDIQTPDDSRSYIHSWEVKLDEA